MYEPDKFLSCVCAGVNSGKHVDLSATPCELWLSCSHHDGNGQSLRLPLVRRHFRSLYSVEAKAVVIQSVRHLPDNLIVVRDEYQLQQQPHSSTAATITAAAAAEPTTRRPTVAAAAATAFFAAGPVHEPEQHGPSPPATVGDALRTERCRRHEPRKVGPGELTDSSHTSLFPPSMPIFMYPSVGVLLSPLFTPDTLALIISSTYLISLRICGLLLYLIIPLADLALYSLPK